eukprot:1160552-Pelagomonas_calceolata.AAC.12
MPHFPAAMLYTSFKLLCLLQSCPCCDSLICLTSLQKSSPPPMQKCSSSCLCRMPPTNSTQLRLSFNHVPAATCSHASHRCRNAPHQLQAAPPGPEPQHQNGLPGLQLLGQGAQTKREEWDNGVLTAALFSQICCSPCCWTYCKRSGTTMCDQRHFNPYGHCYLADETSA